MGSKHEPWSNVVSLTRDASLLRFRLLFVVFLVLVILVFRRNVHRVVTGFTSNLWIIGDPSRCQSTNGVLHGLETHSGLELKLVFVLCIRPWLLCSQ